MLISWVCSQPFARSARSSLAIVDRSHAGERGDANKKPLHYSLWNGLFYFWHKYSLFVFERQQSHGELGFTGEEVSISVLRELLDECRRHYLALVQKKTSVFEHDKARWKPSKPKSKIDMSTVIINEKLKEMLLGDVAEFLNPKVRKWYSKRGISYQRGYLFYGPPGTGKSSFRFSIAGKFDLDIYILNISSLDNRNLKFPFAELPQHCIVLLEDVDAAGSKRTPNSNADVGQP
ncbi:hypothetical protein K469DRAFT_809530, partial [Zopfia rhizophila CBS 207.26]